MDIANALEVYGEMGIIVVSLFGLFWFFLRRYEASNKQVIERSEIIIEDVKAERDVWRETAMTNFSLVAAEQEKTRQMAEAFAARSEDLSTILHFLRSFQQAIPATPEAGDGK